MNKIEGIELDLVKSTKNLSDSSFLDINACTQITSTIRGSLRHEKEMVQLLSIRSLIRGEMFIFVDGEEYGPIFIEQGVTQLPFHVEYDGQFNVYFLPVDDEDDGKPTTYVSVSVI